MSYLEGLAVAARSLDRLRAVAVFGVRTLRQGMKVFACIQKQK